MWFKDCKLDTRGFVGLEWHILIAVYAHLFSKRIIGSKTYLYTIPPRIYELCVFIPFTTKQTTPAPYTAIYPHICTV